MQEIAVLLPHEPRITYAFEQFLRPASANESLFRFFRPNISSCKKATCGGEGLLAK